MAKLKVKALLELLRSNDFEDREKALKNLLQKAEEGKDISAAFPEIIKQISIEEDEENKLFAVTVLCEAVEQGASLEPLPVLVEQLHAAESERVPRICRLLTRCYLNTKQYEKIQFFLSSEASPSMKIGAVWALKIACQRHINITPLIKYLIPLLSDEKKEVRRHTLLTLHEAAGEGFDISTAIPLLMPLLSEPSDLIPEACGILLTAALNGTDISSVIPLAQKQMDTVEEGLNLKWCYTEVIAAHYLSTHQTDLLYALLKNADQDIRWGTCSVFVGVSNTKIDISIFLPTLVELLYDEYFRVEMNAYASLLGYIRTKRENALQIQQLLKTQTGSSVAAKQLSLQCKKILGKKKTKKAFYNNKQRGLS